MTEALHCQRGCRRRGHHNTDCDNPDACPGCEPQPADHGVLCQHCERRLVRLLGPPTDHESIAGASLWLASNLGQHIRTPSGGTRKGSTAGDHFVIVAVAMSALQVSLLEFARDFAQDRAMQPPRTTDPAKVAAWLRPWIATLAAWEPIADTLDHLADLMRDAHGAAPWRGQDPDASDQAAALLYWAPPEDTASVCDRFGIKPEKLLYWKKKGLAFPENETEKPLRWRPWQAYAQLHPQAAQRYETAIQAVGHHDNSIVHSTTLKEAS